MNPYSAEMQKAYHSYLALSGQDPNCQEYIRYARNVTVETSGSPAAAPSNGAEPRDGLAGAILHGLSEEAARLARLALETTAPLALISEQIVPALDIVGQGFERKTVFLPQLLMSAEAAKAAFEEARRKLPASDTVGPSVILATVKGDIHDIGKNIVRAILENYGFHDSKAFPGFGRVQTNRAAKNQRH